MTVAIGDSPKLIVLYTPLPHPENKGFIARLAVSVGKQIDLQAESQKQRG